ncbi:MULTISPECIES: class I SAM-dependent methyltransferase [unclassified Schlesneria]|uniref:class I SAM-dependent methyltransferase n=1 Tax=Schlesneria TaxID=656899 RepID=UPI002F1935B2
MIRLTNRLFGSHPIVVHCPGPVQGHLGWQSFAASALGVHVDSHPPVESFTLLTWNGGDRPEKPNGILESSAARFGCETLVLGQTVRPWVNGKKLQLTADALAGVTTEFVVGMDSGDVLLVDHPDVMVQRFREHFSCDLLFNATGSDCWPPRPEFIMYEQQRPAARCAQGRHWLNAGCWVGRTEFCRKYFRDLASFAATSESGHCDQTIVKMTWPQWYPRVQLDYGCQIFQWFNEDRRVFQVERPVADRQWQLTQWLREFDNVRYGVEVGVFDGSTSDVLLREFPQLTLWMVDPWAPFTGCEPLSHLDQVAFERIFHEALWWTSHAPERRHVLRETSNRAASGFSDGSLDFVFIDANHQYETVCTDLDCWWPKVRTAGYLCGHDYGVYGDATGEWGVKRAVDAFVATQSRELRLGRDGMWLLRK